MRDPANHRGSPSGDDRGVSAVIGAVLLLALVVLLVSIVQTTAIPALNAQHEFEHDQRVQTDLVRLETTVDRVAATGTGETAAVEVGVRYPTRLIFVNPPPVSGELRTTDGGAVTIANAEAAGETGDYWDGTPRTFETTTLAYEPDYNEWDAAPTTVYEPWVVYNRDGEATVPLTASDLVDGREISLVAIDGRYSQSTAGTVGVDAEPNSAPLHTVTVRNGSDPITITVPTGLRADVWRELLADELDPDGTVEDRHVTGVSCEQAPPQPCGELTLTLEPGTYELRLGEVAVGTGASREGATYLTDVEGDATSVPETGRQRLVVEARDRFDNPVSGVDVTASLGGDEGTVRAVSGVTDGDGRAVFVYEAPEAVNGSRDVTVTAQFGDGTAQRTVTFDVRLVDLAGGGDGGGGGDADGGTGDGEPTSADAVSGVEGSVDSRNIAGADRGREASFAISSAEEVTITGFAVETRNDLEGRPFVDRDTTFDGGDLPVTFAGEITVALRDIDASADLGLSGFVDPTGPDADVVVTLQFADGSTLTLGLG